MQGKSGYDRLAGRQVLKVFEVAHESSGAGSIPDRPDPPPDRAGFDVDGCTASDGEGGASCESRGGEVLCGSSQCAEGED